MQWYATSKSSNDSSALNKQHTTSHATPHRKHNHRKQTHHISAKLRPQAATHYEWLHTHHTQQNKCKPSNTKQTSITQHKTHTINQDNTTAAQRNEHGTTQINSTTKHATWQQQQRNIAKNTRQTLSTHNASTQNTSNQNTTIRSGTKQTMQQHNNNKTIVNAQHNRNNATTIINNNQHKPQSNQQQNQRTTKSINNNQHHSSAHNIRTASQHKTKRNAPKPYKTHITTKQFKTMQSNANHIKSNQSKQQNPSRQNQNNTI